ncbi:MAG: 1-acyl-sn-glycerol-3-phosphate acyltransferase [Bacteroidales bacterium]|nr:1-acyl-sn-glycerol-3-phosphate acyltransferase [Bacteroidales bacterium]
MGNFFEHCLHRKGWSIIDKQRLPNKCVICIAPHTSNWDFVWGLLYKHATHLKASFLMKKEWFRFPLGLIMRKLGGIPVNREKKNSLTDIIAEEFNKHDIFRLGITPEGTRKATKQWKLGFYFIALKAKVPIVLAKIDYRKKEIGCQEFFIPSGNVEEDIVKIKNFYRDVIGKKIANFAI